MSQTFRAKITPLVWFRFRDNGWQSLQRVPVKGAEWVSRYYIGDSLSGRTKDWFYWGPIGNPMTARVKTKKAAIARCQKHFDRYVLSLLIVETDGKRALLSEPDERAGGSGK